jgi:hypothetical protein
MEFPLFLTPAQLHKEAMDRLIMEGEFSASESLSTCNISYEIEDVKEWAGDRTIEYVLHIKLKSSYDIIDDHKNLIMEIIGERVGKIPERILPYSVGIVTYFESDQDLKTRKDDAKAPSADDQPKNIMSTTSNIERKSSNEYKNETHNNLAGATKQPRTWNGFRFRSESEIQIARALDKVPGVLFFPNCKARLGHPKNRENREPDFLVCYKGKWGVLEVDGEPTHPPSRTVEDHTRDRLFRLHGILIVEHFDAVECFENADQVVKRFLYILQQTK